MALVPDIRNIVCTLQRRLVYSLKSMSLGLPCILFLWIAISYLNGNVHVVQPGVLYRAGQLSPEKLATVITKYHIKTVINLRGKHPEKAWYADEVKTTMAMNVSHVDLPLSAKYVPNPETIKKLDLLLRTSPRSILIHCYGGADRSGLTAALFKANIMGVSLEEAAEQLSFYYGHFPWFWSRSDAMDIAFSKYAGMNLRSIVADK